MSCVTQRFGSCGCVPAFIFKRSSASEQRRIFAGPLVPRALLRPGRLPVVPLPAGLRFQAMHGDDAGQAYRLALLSDARGAYNVATDPVIDAEALGKLLEARALQVPKQAFSAAMAGAWRLRLIPVGRVAAQDVSFAADVGQ